MPDASRGETTPETQQPSTSAPQEQETENLQQEAVEARQASSENPQQHSAAPAPASSGEVKPPDPVSKGKRKWVKPLVIAVACVLVLGVVVDVYFVWQASEKRSIASAAVDQLRESETIAGLAIPSEWGDQTGFSMGGVDVDSVEGGILSGGSAQVAIKADIDNGHYAGQVHCDIAMKKDGPSWVADDIRQTALSYYPVSGVSDEVLLGRIPELVAEAYSFTSEAADALPDPSTLFGDGTTGVVSGNTFEGFTDEVEMMLETQRDGNTYQAGLSLNFTWVDGGEKPADWRLVFADLDDEAYLLAGSFLCEGVDMPDDYVPLNENEWLASISPQLDFREGSQYAWAFLKNPPDSSVDIVVTVKLDDGQVVYTSPRIPPNHKLYAIRADQLPAHGVYDAKAYFRAYEGGTLVGDNALNTRVIVS